jgi:hypothetical protein
MVTKINLPSVTFSGRWLLWKNVLVCAFGVMSLIFGTLTSIEDIIKVYSDPEVLNEFHHHNGTLANITSISDALAAIIAPEDFTTLSP